MKYNVLSGNYPFTEKLGEVHADDELTAHAKAMKEFAQVDHQDPGLRHPVIEPASESGYAPDR